MRSAFAEIEPDIRDLTRMAQLAENQVHRAFGELEHRDGKCIEIPDTEAAEVAIFAVSKMLEMAKQLEQTYDRLSAERESRAA